MRYFDFYKELNDKSLNIFSIGKSTLGKDILCCHVGKMSGSQILVQAGIHAREYVTSLLALSQAKSFSKHHNFGAYFILCTNPDGVEVVLEGFSVLTDEKRKFCELKNFDHKLFKANANLVDLNTNFDALWGKGKSNLTYPNFESYVGKSAESEIETKILCEFTKKIKPVLTFSYHTRGEVVYYGFDTQSENSLNRDRILGEKISKSLDFPLERSFNSCGGYKDWCCDKLDIPAYTLEFGNDSLSHPIGREHLKTFETQSQNLFDIVDEYINEKQ